MSHSSALKIFTHSTLHKFLSVEGADAERFLQGLCTVDVKNFSLGDHSLALVLNTKGKPLSPLHLYKKAASKYWLSVPSLDFDSVFEFFNKYIIADDVLVSPLEEFDQAVRVIESPFLSGRENLFKKSPVPQAKDVFHQSVQESWGLRLPLQNLGPREEIWWIKKLGSLPFQMQTGASEIYTQARIDAGVPEWRVDFGPESLPIEYPFADSISFFKGCYLGQEVIARGTFRGHVTKVFARFKGKTDLLGDFIYSLEEPERPVGKLTTVLKNGGLGQIRLSALELSKLFQKTEKGEKILFEAIEPLVHEKTYKT